MTLDQFVTTYDIAGSVVLLEGKRDVKSDDQESLVQLGRLLVLLSSSNFEISSYAIGTRLLENK